MTRQANSPQEQNARMNHTDNSLPERLSGLSDLLEQRLAIVGTLATSLEAGRLALARNDAEAIARGAAHQAELCRQWSGLEDQLRFEAARQLERPGAKGTTSSDTERAQQVEAEWRALRQRIRYLSRVHWSLLRHLQRSLGILQRVVDSCAGTYSPSRVERDARLRAGE